MVEKTFLNFENHLFRLEKDNDFNYYAYLDDAVVWNLKFKMGENNIPEIEWHRFDSTFEQQGKRLRVAPLLYLKVLNELLPFNQFHSTPARRNEEGSRFQQNLRIGNNCIFNRRHDGDIYIYQRKNIIMRLIIKLLIKF